MSEALGELLARTRCLLLDFDGPVCSIFAGRPPRNVVDELVSIVASQHCSVPDSVSSSRDPFDVLRYAATRSPQLAQRIEDALRTAELRAIATATPTPHAADAIQAWKDAGRAVGIVSNNSLAAVHAYVLAHGIHVDVISARDHSDPALLKPSPQLVERALGALDADTAASVLVGDSVTDIAAADRARILSIGFANKPGKREKLAHAGATVVIDDMSRLLSPTGLA